jgi:hypothetical protein
MLHENVCTWRDVASFCKVNGNIATYVKYKSFFIGESNPRRKLRNIVSRLEDDLPEFLNKNTIPSYGLTIDTLLKNKVLLHMSLNGNEIDNATMRAFLVRLLEDNSLQALLKTHGGECIYGRNWAARCRLRWNITVHVSGKCRIDTRVEMSTDDYKRMMQRTSDSVRRKPNDPLPCKLIRLNNGDKKRLRYEDEDEEDCWGNTLLGGIEEYERLTLDDRLMLPCSVRSKISFLVPCFIL